MIRGEATLATLSQLEETAKYIRHHQENWDGSGYPDGSSEDAIPHGERIMGLIRHYVDLSAGPLIEGVFDQGEAEDFMRRQSGIRYDPKVVTRFLMLLQELPEEIQQANEVKLPLQAVRPKWCNPRPHY